jgi:hypothetical protein
MSNTIKFSCVIDTTNPACPLGMEIWLDDQQIFHSNHVTSSTVFDHEILDTDGEHQLKFVMKNKTQDHTKVDESGAIVSDARLIIKDFAFDSISPGNMISEFSVYTHDFNGTGVMIDDKFYGEMGCNGTVRFEFSTPIYLWLLEHM